MNQKAEQLYQSMLLDLDRCQKSEFGEMATIECMFTASNKYWEILKLELYYHEFKSKAEEILFFKTIKPRFKAKAIYCGLVTHALLFKSSSFDPAILEKFWRQEASRLEKFINANETFCQYYFSGFKDQDEEWFTRKSRDNDNLRDRSATLQDHLASNLLALQEYTEYVEKELKALLV